MHTRREFLAGAAAFGALGRVTGADAGTPRKPLKFLFISDHHIESDFVEYRGKGEVADVYTMWKPGNHAAVEKTYEFINADPFCRDCDFALFGGDQINTGYAARPVDMYAEKSNYFRTLDRLDLHRTTVGRTADLDFRAAEWTVTGNLGPGRKPYQVSPRQPVSRVIAIQGNHDTGVEEFYRDAAFTAGGVRFITFFADYVGLPPTPGSRFNSTAKIADKTVEFVEAEMKRAKADPAIRHIVLVSHWAIADKSKDFHHPIIGACKENGMSPNRDRLVGLAEKYGVKLMINGHEHNGRYPVGKAGALSDINCGTLAAGKNTGAFAVVEIDDAEARFTVYSRAFVEERDGEAVVTDAPRRLFEKKIPLV